MYSKLQRCLLIQSFLFFDELLFPKVAICGKLAKKVLKKSGVAGVLSSKVTNSGLLLMGSVCT